MTLSEVQKTSTSQAIVDQLISCIKRGELRPGDRLPPENELMGMLRVGRSSIREAKQVLATMNLIEAHAGRGSFIKEMRPEDIVNPDVAWLLMAGENVWALHEARELLEVQVAVLAARRATEADLAAMEIALRKLQDAVEAGVSVYDCGMEFHFALFRTAHNPVLVNLYHRIMSLLREYQRPVYEQYSDPRAEFENHTLIYEAIRNRDSVSAEEKMRAHLGYVVSVTRRGIEAKESGLVNDR